MSDSMDVEELVRGRDIDDDVPELVEHSSRMEPFAHEPSWSSGSQWVELPPSIAGRVREVTKRTGLSMEGIVWDAVDFYVRERIYEWVRPGA
jgi:hypothetical protein